MSDAGGGSRPPDSPYDEHALHRRAKAEIRRRMRTIRRAVPADARAARSAAVAEQVIALPVFAQARVIAAFIAVRAEIDPAIIVAKAHELGKTVVMPRVDESAGEIVMHEWSAEHPLVQSSFDVPEPLETAPRMDASEIDLVIVPALALDERGHRIGYGAGYYDRFLATTTRATSVSIAFDFQLIPEVANTPADRAVDVIVTDRRVIPVARS